MNLNSKQRIAAHDLDLSLQNGRQIQARNKRNVGMYSTEQDSKFQAQSKQTGSKIKIVSPQIRQKSIKVQLPSSYGQISPQFEGIQGSNAIIISSKVEQDLSVNYRKGSGRNNNLNEKMTDRVQERSLLGSQLLLATHDNKVPASFLNQDDLGGMKISQRQNVPRDFRDNFILAPQIQNFKRTQHDLNLSKYNQSQKKKVGNQRQQKVSNNHGSIDQSQKLLIPDRYISLLKSQQIVKNNSPWDQLVTQSTSQSALAHNLNLNLNHSPDLKPNIYDFQQQPQSSLTRPNQKQNWTRMSNSYLLPTSLKQGISNKNDGKVLQVAFSAFSKAAGASSDANQSLLLHEKKVKNVKSSRIVRGTVFKSQNFTQRLNQLNTVNSGRNSQMTSSGNYKNPQQSILFENQDDRSKLMKSYRYGSELGHYQNSNLLHQSANMNHQDGEGVSSNLFPQMSHINDNHMQHQRRAFNNKSRLQPLLLHQKSQEERIVSRRSYNEPGVIEEVDNRVVGGVLNENEGYTETRLISPRMEISNDASSVYLKEIVLKNQNSTENLSGLKQKEMAEKIKEINTSRVNKALKNYANRNNNSQESLNLLLTQNDYTNNQGADQKTPQTNLVLEIGKKLNKDLEPATPQTIKRDSMVSPVLNIDAADIRNVQKDLANLEVDNLMRRSQLVITQKPKQQTDVAGKQKQQLYDSEIHNREISQISASFGDYKNIVDMNSMVSGRGSQNTVRKAINSGEEQANLNFEAQKMLNQERAKSPPTNQNESILIQEKSKNNRMTPTQNSKNRLFSGLVLRNNSSIGQNDNENANRIDDQNVLIVQKRETLPKNYIKLQTQSIASSSGKPPQQFRGETLQSLQLRIQNSKSKNEDLSEEITNQNTYQKMLINDSHLILSSVGSPEPEIEMYVGQTKKSPKRQLFPENEQYETIKHSQIEQKSPRNKKVSNQRQALQNSPRILMPPPFQIFNDKSNSQSPTLKQTSTVNNESKNHHPILLSNSQSNASKPDLNELGTSLSVESVAWKIKPQKVFELPFMGDVNKSKSKRIANQNQKQSPSNLVLSESQNVNQQNAQAFQDGASLLTSQEAQINLTNVQPQLQGNIQQFKVQSQMKGSKLQPRFSMKMAQLKSANQSEIQEVQKSDPRQDTTVEKNQIKQKASTQFKSSFKAVYPNQLVHLLQNKADSSQIYANYLEVTNERKNQGSHQTNFGLEIKPQHLNKKPESSGRVSKIAEETCRGESELKEGESSLNDYLDSKKNQIMQNKLLNESDGGTQKEQQSENDSNNQQQLNLDYQESNLLSCNTDSNNEKLVSASHKRHSSCGQERNQQMVISHHIHQGKKGGSIISVGVNVKSTKLLTNDSKFPQSDSQLSEQNPPDFQGDYFVAKNSNHNNNPTITGHNQSLTGKLFKHAKLAEDSPKKISKADQKKLFIDGIGSQTLTKVESYQRLKENQLLNKSPQRLVQKQDQTNPMKEQDSTVQDLVNKNNMQQVDEEVKKSSAPISDFYMIKSIEISSKQAPGVSPKNQQNNSSLKKKQDMQKRKQYQQVTVKVQENRDMLASTLTDVNLHKFVVSGGASGGVLYQDAVQKEQLTNEELRQKKNVQEAQVMIFAQKSLNSDIWDELNHRDNNTAAEDVESKREGKGKQYLVEDVTNSNKQENNNVSSQINPSL